MSSYPSIDETQARLRLTWLCPDDKGGGVVSVAEGCCKEAAAAGHEVTLLLALAPTGHVSRYGEAKIATLDSRPPYRDIPNSLVSWLAFNPQDVIIINDCEQADLSIPYLPSGTRVLYCVHDTAEQYFSAALRYESSLDGLVAVSEAVAKRIRRRLKDESKLHVVHNGTDFPIPIDEVLNGRRSGDLLFLGGDNPIKGAGDVIVLWRQLCRSGFAGKLHWFGSVGSALRKKIALLPSAGQILLYGRRSRDEVFDVATQCKILLMLSRIEPFGMVTIECMGMGCLPVAWDIDGGTKEIVRPSEGVFVRLGNYCELANGVYRGLEMHGGSFRSSTARIRQEFSDAAMWARYSTALHSVFGSAAAKRELAGQEPPAYRPPFRCYQLLPASLRSAIRSIVGSSPRLGYMLRDFRGK